LEKELQPFFSAYNMVRPIIITETFYGLKQTIGLEVSINKVYAGKNDIATFFDNKEAQDFLTMIKETVVPFTKTEDLKISKVKTTLLPLEVDRLIKARNLKIDIDILNKKAADNLALPEM
jgi:hypothetical protein